MTSPILIVLPSCGLFGSKYRRPASSASISCTALSVSTENNGSPALTASPGFFSQAANCASSIDQPCLGRMTGKAMGVYLLSQ